MSDQHPSTSPTPDGNASGGGPSPLMIGKRFVKQYYQILSSTPEQIFRFYQPTSFLSHAEGSNPTDPSTFETYGIAERWGTTSKKRIELENGAIDAQPSVNGSILLVVTGHVVFVEDGKEDRKAFVHTFFLGLVPNTKRFYVHNDVLRFLNKATETTTEEAPVVDEPEKKKEAEEKPAKETPAPKAVEEKPVVEEAPGSGVEETKEVAPEEEEKPAPAVEEKKAPAPEPKAPAVEKPKVEQTKAAPVAAKSSESTGKNSSGKGKKQRGRGRSPTEQQPKQQPAAKPVPGSWASLVASGGGPPVPSTPVPPSPVKPAAPVEKKKEEEAKAPAPAAQEKESKDGGRPKHGDRPKRDPDCTLVIKGLPDGTKESDLLSVFETFATQTKANIVGTNVSAHRGLAFVDYDAVAPVMAALEKHSKEPLQMKGRVLEVDQKTAEQRARRNQRGGYRSGSPGRGGSGSGGRQNQYRRGNAGRGDRGGGRGAAGGGRGGGNRPQ